MRKMSTELMKQVAGGICKGEAAETTNYPTLIDDYIYYVP